MDLVLYYCNEPIACILVWLGQWTWYCIILDLDCVSCMDNWTYMFLVNPINIWCVKYLLCFVNCYICKIRRRTVKFLIFPYWFYNFRSPTTFSGRKTPKSGRKTPKSGRKMSKTEIWISNRFPIGKSGKKQKTDNFPFPGTSGKSFSVGKVNPAPESLALSRFGVRSRRWVLFGWSFVNWFWLNDSRHLLIVLGLHFSNQVDGGWFH